MDIITKQDFLKNSILVMHHQSPDTSRKNIDMMRLNGIQPYLEFAGLPRPARPLLHQEMLGRAIIPIESVDLYLCWYQNRIYIKILPEILLCHDIWRDYHCKDEKVIEAAAGFLLSYFWLVCTKLDLKIAQERGLISNDISWVQWTHICKKMFAEYRFPHISKCQ